MTCFCKCYLVALQCLREPQSIYVLIMFLSDACIPCNVPIPCNALGQYNVRHCFFVLYNCLDYSPSQENGGVNQRLEKLEQFVNTGTNIA